MTYFREMLAEVDRGESRLLLSKTVGPCAVRLLIVQRSDGSVWECEDWLDGSPASEAVAWSLPVLERFYLMGSRMMPWADGQLDYEALFRHIQWRRGSDEQAAAVEAAEYLVRVK